MTVVVESSTDQVEAALNGGKFPIPPDVAADNAARSAKKEGKEPDPVAEAEKAILAEKAKPDAAKDDPDDIEGEDGLTPRQKREFTKSMLATIAKKHRAQREAEEFATNQFNSKTAAEQRAAELAKENAELKAKLTPPAAKDSELKTPVREDFKTDQEYWDAMVDYRVEKKLQVAEAAAAKQREEDYQTKVIETATARIVTARELQPDFDDVVNAIDARIPVFVAAHMQESEMIGELTYYFGQNPSELTRLDKFTRDLKEGTRAYGDAVRKQLVELGKIESKLTPFTAPKAEKADNAPEASQSKSTNGLKAEPETGSAPSKPRNQAPIITPLNGGSASQVDRDEADLTGTQVITRWQKKHGVTLTARKRH
jgi:hypothetical protein